MKDLPNIFGSKVFSDKVMKKRMSDEDYIALKTAVERGNEITLEIANSVAVAMKEWAIEQGATHYTHWFQPMTGITAEKHEGFIMPDNKGSVLMGFSGKELVKGESDASSFPSGGLRGTSEARGYTAWDPSSYAFVRNTTIYIPTAFYSYSGEALDKKVPLLRSMQTIDEAGVRLLHALGYDDVNKIITYVGAEQEYFLVDKKVYEKRLDLINTGRTLFGAAPAKSQELDDQYFGSIKPRVLKFMQELDEELWRLGVSSKTRHNEAAPAQHELAPIYCTANVATDHNQIVMEVMKSVANENGFVCLLNEKPYAFINGSGKHNNWSICTEDGINLLKPCTEGKDGDRFMLFLVAVIQAVDKYQNMLRIVTSSASNDNRLGANEAPPAIISIFLGDELDGMIGSIVGNEVAKVVPISLDSGAKVLPHFIRDTTDRNRTSPFAYTGNKFEFRALGSSFSIADVNTVLNTIVAESLNEFAEVIEKATDKEKAIREVLADAINAHRKIIFNGNGYSAEWVKEAERRGLYNLPTTPDALSHMLDKINVDLFAKYGVFSKSEFRARYEIECESYYKKVRIEAKTLLIMINKSILPPAIAYQNELLDVITKKINLGLNKNYENDLLEKISKDVNKISSIADEIEKASIVEDFSTNFDNALYTKDEIKTRMDAIRLPINDLERKVADKFWILPTYADLLNSEI